MTFPVETVPDGAVMAPHHLYGVLLASLAALVCWDDYRRREPVVVFAGSAGAALAFLLVWVHYPVAGALLVLLGLLAVLAAPVLWRGVYPRRWTALAVLGGLVGLDDWVSHALGVWTPLDALWHAYMVGVMA